MESVKPGFLFGMFTYEFDCKELMSNPPPQPPEALPSLPAALSDAGMRLPCRKPASNQSDICLTEGCIHAGMCLSSWPI